MVGAAAAGCLGGCTGSRSGSADAASATHTVVLEVSGEDVSGAEITYTPASEGEGPSPGASGSSPGSSSGSAGSSSPSASGSSSAGTSASATPDRPAGQDADRGTHLTAELPWSQTFRTARLEDVSVVAHTTEGAGELTCTIRVDGQVRDQVSARGRFALVACDLATAPRRSPSAAAGASAG